MKSYPAQNVNCTAVEKPGVEGRKRHPNSQVWAVSSPKASVDKCCAGQSDTAPFLLVRASSLSFGEAPPPTDLLL